MIYYSTRSKRSSGLCGDPSDQPLPLTVPLSRFRCHFPAPGAAFPLPMPLPLSVPLSHCRCHCCFRCHFPAAVTVYRYRQRHRNIRTLQLLSWHLNGCQSFVCTYARWSASQCASTTMDGTRSRRPRSSSGNCDSARNSAGFVSRSTQTAVRPRSATARTAQQAEPAPTSTTC